MTGIQGTEGISRRSMLMFVGAGALVASVAPKLLSPQLVVAKESGVSISPDSALQRLLDGNKRFVAGKDLNPDRSPLRRQELAKNQHPFAVILGCSDSRVPPEVVFDQGLGDLFTIRVAGNFVETGGLESIDYAVEQLGSPLVVVLGHRRCGAVTAVVESIRTGKPLPSYLSKFTQAIDPGIESVKNQSGDAVDNAVRANIKYVTNELKESQPILAPRVKKGNLKVVGAYYNLDTGAVELIA